MPACLEGLTYRILACKECEAGLPYFRIDAIGVNENLGYKSSIHECVNRFQLPRRLDEFWDRNPLR